MAVVKVLPGGSSGGFAGPGREKDDGGATRGLIQCWTPGAARRSIRWLWSILPADLPDAGGWAVTLTQGGRPDNADQWHWVLRQLLDTVKRASDRYVRRNGDRADPRGVVIEHAVHWIIEWTAEGRPHLHMAVYSPDPDIDAVMIAEWFRLCRLMAWPSTARGQHVVPIEGVTGWLEYVSKHSARGVDHYQRQGAPEGWTRTGRLWGHRGTWPTWSTEDYELNDAEFYRWRRLLVGYQRAKLRRLGAPKSGYKRVGNALRDRERGRFVGVGYWVDAEVCLKLLSTVHSGGGSPDRDWEKKSYGFDHACHHPGKCRRLLPADDYLHGQKDW